MKLFYPFLVLLLFLPALCVPSTPLSDTTPPFFYKLQNALQTKDPQAYMQLFASDEALQLLETSFINEFVAFQPTRTVLQLGGVKDNRMRIHILIEGPEEARFESWSLEMGREGDRDVILARDVISTIEGLYRLRMGPAGYAVQNVEIRHFDATIRLESGSLFPILAGGELAGALFLGTGAFRFAPADRTERQQINLFCKHQELETPLRSYYIRAAAPLLKKYFDKTLAGQPRPPDPELYEKGSGISQEADRNAFGVRLPFTDELWFPQVQGGDLYSEIDTELGKLVYQHAPEETEDILLADKESDRIISLYSSRGRRIRFILGEDFRVLSYKMNVKYNPSTLHLAGTADMLLSTLSPTSSIVFKLNQNLRVTGIDSGSGSMLYFQEKNTNNLHVMLGALADEGQEIQLRFRYEGKINPDQGRSEMQASNRTIGNAEQEFFIPPSYLYSNQSFWYPQLASRPYSEVEITVTVPDGYAAIANGQLVKQEDRGNSIAYSYKADLPVKYYSMLVGRLQGKLTQESIVPIQAYYYNIDKSNAAKQAKTTDGILRFYSNYFGRYPYRSLNLALRPAEEPGGHAPAGVVIANRVFSYRKARFARDPLYIPAYPDFLLAHEVAHQWWGQAVGWRGYRDQWLSEGFAQFAAAEYIRSVHGEKAWVKVSEEFRDWIREKTHAGPLVLGTRLGHLTQDPRAFSALLYNKGAYVLNMLKGWLGPEEFQKCLAEFYSLYQFKRATLDDFIGVAKRHSSEDLTPFFDQWLYNWTIPQVEWDWRTEATPDGQRVWLKFRQPAEDFYHLKLPVEIRDGKGQLMGIQAVVHSADQEIEIAVPFTPTSVSVDPLHENLADYRQK